MSEKYLEKESTKSTAKIFNDFFYCDIITLNTEMNLFIYKILQVFLT